MSMDEARAEVAKIIEKVLADLDKAQREASQGIESEIRRASRGQIDTQRALIEETKAMAAEIRAMRMALSPHVCVEQVHGTLGTVGVGILPDSPFTFSRELAPGLAVGDVIALRAINGSIMRMECVEMTGDTLTFREAGE